MTQEIEQETRVQIAGFLPEAISKTLKSYEDFINDNGETSENSKEFSAHHTACKAAISHLELLLKLARWADLPDKDDATENKNLMAMLSQAENKVMQHKSDEKVK